MQNWCNGTFRTYLTGARDSTIVKMRAQNSKHLCFKNLVGSVNIQLLILVHINTEFSAGLGLVAWLNGCIVEWLQLFGLYSIVVVGWLDSFWLDS